MEETVRITEKRLDQNGLPCTLERNIYDILLCEHEILKNQDMIMQNQKNLWEYGNKIANYLAYERLIMAAVLFASWYCA